MLIKNTSYIQKTVTSKIQSNVFVYFLEMCIFLFSTQLGCNFYLVLQLFKQILKILRKSPLTFPFASVASGLRKCVLVTPFPHVPLWRNVQLCLGACWLAGALGQVGQHCCGADLFLLLAGGVGVPASRLFLAGRRYETSSKDCEGCYTWDRKWDEVLDFAGR